MATEYRDIRQEVSEAKDHVIIATKRLEKLLNTIIHPNDVEILDEVLQTLNKGNWGLQEAINGNDGCQCTDHRPIA